MNFKKILVTYFFDCHGNNHSGEIPYAFDYTIVPKLNSMTKSYYYEVFLIDIIKYLSTNQCRHIQNSIQTLLQYEYFILIKQNNRNCYYKVPITSLCTPVYHSDIPVNTNELKLLISKSCHNSWQLNSTGLIHALDEIYLRCNDQVLLDCMHIKNRSGRIDGEFDIYNPLQSVDVHSCASNNPMYSSFRSGSVVHSPSKPKSSPPKPYQADTYRDSDVYISNERNLSSTRNDEARSNSRKHTEEHNMEGLFSYATSFFNGASSLVETVATTGNSLINDLVSTTSNMGNNSVTLQNNNTVTIVKELAEGGFSMVYLVAGDEINKTNGNTTKPTRHIKQPQQQYYYALKRMRCSEEESSKEAVKEINILNRFNNTNNKNIIQLLDYRINKSLNAHVKEYDLLFPLYSDGSAWNHIEKYMNFTQDRRDFIEKYPFDECLALQIIYGVSNALMTLHTLGYTHRDLKPHNIMLKFVNNNNCDRNSPGRLVCPVLMDLGSVGPAKTNSPPISTKSQALDLEDRANSHTSPAFKPPELQSVPYNAYTCSQFVTDKQQLKAMEESIQADGGIILDERVDIWSLGCVTFCLAFGLSPFESLKEGWLIEHMQLYIVFETAFQSYLYYLICISS